MKIIIEPLALETLNEISEFIDGINTPGAGERWVDKILDFLFDYAKPNLQYALCQNIHLAQKGLSCITFNNWVIAFKIERNNFIVSQVIHGPSLQ